MLQFARKRESGVKVRQRVVRLSECLEQKRVIHVATNRRVMAAVENGVISVRIFVVEPEARIDVFMRRIESPNQQFRRPAAVMRLKEVTDIIFLPRNAE